jgi:sugar O-acyltransferase (sialic acid O-acetyltransferase NeuD family)
MIDILIVGGGGHAKVVAAILKKHNDWNPIGYTDPFDNGPLLGLPYLGTDSVIIELVSDKGLKHAVIGIGLVGSSKHREGVIRNIQSMRLSLPSICSPNAVINEGVRIGGGSIVTDGAVIQPGVQIGTHSIINTGAIVDHDCTIGDHVHIAPGVTLSGDVHLGHHILVGTAAGVLQGVNITDDVVIGGGAMVVSDLDTSGTYLGVPAKLKVP